MSTFKLGEVADSGTLAPPLPNLLEAGAHYWQAGKSGQYSLGWCKACELWLHPARELCHQCHQPADAKQASGFALLASYTINHQAWLKQFDSPYIIAIITPIEDTAIQLTTRLIDADPSALIIGMRLTVTFKQYDDTWLPLFKPSPNAKPPKPTTAPVFPRFNKCLSGNNYEHAAAFTGMGKSDIGRKLPQRPAQLSASACLNAIADSGLNINDIDGVCAFPGSSGLPGLSDGGVRELSYHLGLTPTWHMGAQELAGQAGALTAAMLALSAGLCKHVLCFTQFATSAPPLPALSQQRISGEPRWALPYGCVSPANWIAMYAKRYMHQYQVTEALLGTLAIAQRNNAMLNPDALYQTPLTMNSYVNSRNISTPFKLLDCDTPCDGAIAFVLSRTDCANDMPQPPIYIEACGTAITEPQSWDQSTLCYQPNVLSASQHLWSRTDFTPKDIDIAELYDGFTFNVICWLEALGFCYAGGAADFIGDGSRLAITGSLPLNTHGGHLNAGRSNGYGHIYEAVLQLRQQAQARQVQGAKTALVSTGGGIPACAMLLKSFC